MLYLLIIFTLFCQITFGDQISVCKALKYSGAVYTTDALWNIKSVIYTYNLQMKVDIDNQNITYPNIITVSNFEDWSLNSSLYYRTSPLWFEYEWNWGGSPYINCTYLNETCVFSFPNGQITLFFNFNFNNSVINIIDANWVFINEGNILGGVHGYIMNQNNHCITGIMSGYGSANNHYMRSNETACCIENYYIEIPSKSDSMCEEFTSTTAVEDNTQNRNIDLTVIYSLIKDDYNTNINMSVYLSQNSSMYYSYYFEITNKFVSQGTILKPQLYFEANLNGNSDVEWNFVFNVYGNNTYSGIMLGQINRINGVYYKRNLEFFTASDPCSTKSSGVPFTNATYNTSFCCTRFKNDAPTTTTTPLTTTTTSRNPTTIPLTTTTTGKPQSSSNPQSNYIGSPCSNDTSQAWLDIIFVVDTSKAMSKRELNTLAAQISTIMTDFSFAQTGEHTVRAAIIGYASDVKIYYQLNDTTNYDDFVDALFALANHAHSDDSGVNVQGALQQAYNHLKSEPSQRRQVIVLVAAAYSDAGFQGAGVTANIIKQNGVCIVVINFEASQGVLTTALQNISCPGFYYISNDNDLNEKFPYALTQLNCICPPGSLQFTQYNTAWKNYTRYADCLFGSGTAILPKYAERSCQPGVLVAVTSQSKLDFITDNIVPYAFNSDQKKKFTIGLHKSDFDEEWKWWGYNKTEYPLEAFPPMLNNPDPKDNYGYMWNHYGFNWTLQTSNNIPLPYICQLRACDAQYICDQTQTKKLKLV